MSTRSSAGAASLWRYVVRAAVMARMDELRTTLRVEDARADDAATEAARRLLHQQQLGLSAFVSGGKSRPHSPALTLAVRGPVCHNSADPDNLQLAFVTFARAEAPNALFLALVRV